MAKITEGIIKEFQNKRIVHRREIVSFLKSESKTTTAIDWLLKSGKALFIKKGLYYLKKTDEWFRDYIEVNPLILAGYIHPKGVVGYHASLKCLGKAYSESTVFQVALDKSVPRVCKPFEFQNGRYEFYRTNLSFGIVVSVIDDVKVRHFSKERIILEGLMFPDRFLGLSEFLQSIENITWINPDKVLSMLNNYPLKTVSMRLGWLLERQKSYWHIDEGILKKLEKNKPESNILLNKKKTKYNYLVKRWKLMVPKTINELNEY